MASKRFGIALSFPGEQRPFVAQVAGHLAERIGHGRVLYDAYYEAEFARLDLDTYLQRLYHDESESGLRRGPPGVGRRFSRRRPGVVPGRARPGPRPLGQGPAAGAGGGSSAAPCWCSTASSPCNTRPAPWPGQLRTPGVQALLVQLASAGQPGLILLTTRERIADLAEYERREDYPGGSVARHDLSNLSHADGARLLHELGCCRAGAAAIEPDDRELVEASREVRGHALTLALLGGYLAQAHWGDIRRRAEVRLQDADETRGGKAFQVMAAYETWFAREGEHGARELAALRLIGFFDRSADVGCLAALREAPPIPGLTEPLVDLSAVQWNITLSRLAECGLIERGASDGVEDTAVDAHPLVREYLAARLRESSPGAWREGHRRLYDHLKASAPYRPDDLAGLEPLYQAVAHGCLAGLHQRACDEVYFDRISRGNQKYVIGKLGAFGADLAAVACFFDEPWRRVSPTLPVTYKALLLNNAAFRLRALGRLIGGAGATLSGRSCDPGWPVRLAQRR